MESDPTIDAWSINSNDNICGPCPYCKCWHFHSRFPGPLMANCIGTHKHGHYVQVYRGKAPAGLQALVHKLSRTKRQANRQRVREEIQALLGC